MIAPKLGTINAVDGTPIKVDEAFFLATSVVYGAVFIAGGKGLADQPEAIHFVNEAYKHCKPIAATGDGADLLMRTFVDANAEGVVASGKSVIANFIADIAKHRFWSREEQSKIPA